jgi:hypothetical protein
LWLPLVVQLLFQTVLPEVVPVQPAWLLLVEVTPEMLVLLLAVPEAQAELVLVAVV